MKSILSVAEAYTKMSEDAKSLAATDAAQAQQKQEDQPEIPSWVPGNIPGEKKKEFAEAAKKAWESDNTQFDFDGRTYKITEKLHGDQDKLDVNNNGKVDGEDLAALRAGEKPAVKEDHMENETETPGQTEYPGSGMKDVNGNGEIDGEDKAEMPGEDDDEEENDEGLEESVRLKKSQDMLKVAHGAMSRDEYKKKWAHLKKPKNKLAGPGGLYKNLVKEGEENPTDKLTIDVPAMIRALEKSREDFKSDEDIHNFVQDLLKKKDSTIDTNALPTNESVDESLDEDLNEASTMELDPEVRKKYGKHPHKVASFDSMSHYDRAMTNAWSNHDHAQDFHAIAKKIAAKGHAGSENHWKALKHVKHYEGKRDYHLRQAAKAKKAETQNKPTNESVNEAKLATLKAVVTKKNTDGTYDTVGTNNRTVVTGTEKHIRNKAKEYAKGPHKIEFHRSDKFYSDPHKTAFVEGNDQDESNNWPVKNLDIPKVEPIRLKDVDHEQERDRAVKAPKMFDSKGNKITKPVKEALDPKADAGEWISDFVHSTDPKFDGKSPEKRKEMALAAYYQARRDAGLKEEVMTEETATDLSKKAHALSAAANTAKDHKTAANAHYKAAEALRRHTTANAAKTGSKADAAHDAALKHEELGDKHLEKAMTKKESTQINENVAGDARAVDLTTAANQASALAHSTPSEAGALAHHDAATKAHQHAADHYRVYAHHAGDPELRRAAEIHHKFHTDMAQHHTLKGVSLSMDDKPADNVNRYASGHVEESTAVNEALAHDESISKKAHSLSATAEKSNSSRDHLEAMKAHNDAQLHHAKLYHSAAQKKDSAAKDLHSKAYHEHKMAADIHHDKAQFVALTQESVKEGTAADAKGGPEVMDPVTKKAKEDADKNTKAEEAPYTNKADGSENVVPADKPKADPSPMPKLTKEQTLRSVADAYVAMQK